MDTRHVTRPFVLFFLALPIKSCPSPVVRPSNIETGNVLPTLRNLFLDHPSLVSELSRQNDVTLLSQQRDI